MEGVLGSSPRQDHLFAVSTWDIFYNCFLLLFMCKRLGLPRVAAQCMRSLSCAPGGLLHLRISPLNLELWRIVMRRMGRHYHCILASALVSTLTPRGLSVRGDCSNALTSLGREALHPTRESGVSVP